MTIGTWWVSGVVAMLAVTAVGGCGNKDSTRPPAPPSPTRSRPPSPVAADQEPALDDCLADRREAIVPAVEISDPRSQGEVLGIGFRRPGGSQLIHVDGFLSTGLRDGAGHLVEDVTITHHALAGRVADKTGYVPLSGAGWTGATVVGKIHCTNPTLAGRTRSITVRFVDAAQRPTAGTIGPATATGESWFYRLELDPGDGGGSRNACGDRAGGQDVAFVVPGHWDETGTYIRTGPELSFACLSRGAAWCLSEGYADDPGELRGKPDLFQACNRMVRADYCGDGSSATKEGTLVTMWDSHVATQGSGAGVQRFEAAWSAARAVCYDHPRYQPVPGGPPLPACLATLPKCSSPLEAKPYAQGLPLLFNGSCTPAPCMANDQAARPSGAVRPHRS